MNRLSLILLCILASVNYLFSQQVENIPDHNFWDVSYYKYFFHVDAGNHGYPERPYPYKPDKSFNELAQEIDRCYTGKCKWGSKIHVIDTNLSSLLPKAFELFRKQTTVDMEYCSEGDTLYLEFLTLLYNASLQKSNDTMSLFLQLALDSYNRIPEQSISKALGYLQLNYAKRYLDKQSYILDVPLILKLDTLSQQAVSSNNLRWEDFAKYYECLGDYQQSYRVTELWLPSYKKAIYYAEMIDDDYRIFILQRLREKIISSLIPIGGQLRKDLEDEMREQIDSLDSQYYTAEEFRYHNRLIIANYNRSISTDKKYSDNLWTECAKAIYDDGPHRLDLDVTLALGNAQFAAYGSSYYPLCRKANILILNQGLYQHSFKKIAFWGTIYNIFLTCVADSQYDDARLINQYFLKDAEEHGSSYMQAYLPNEASILISQKKLDSAENLINRILDTIEVFKDYTWYQGAKGNCYFMLRNIASYHNDGRAWAHYDTLLKSVETNTSQVLAHVTSADIRFKQDITVNNLNNQIDYYIEYGNQMLLRKLAMDSLLVLTRKNDSLNKRILTDSLDKQVLLVQSKVQEAELQRSKAKANRLLADAIQRKKNNQLWWGFIGFIAMLALVYFFMQRRNEALKRRSIEFELDSYKGAFFGHAIKHSFQMIESRIEVGLLDNNKPDFEIAGGIVNGLSELFLEVAKDLPKGSNLYREILLGEVYVKTMNLVNNSDIVFQNEVNRDIAEKLPIPQRLLIHLFVNAIEHGELHGRKGAKIIVSLTSHSDGVSYLFQVIDNGIGLNQFGLQNLRSNGGLSILKRGLEYFNKDKQGIRYFFNPQSDIESSEISGFNRTIASIRIVKND